MMRKATFTAVFMLGGIACAIAQQAQPQVPGIAGAVPADATNDLPPKCWDRHTNQVRPATAADAKEVSPGPTEAGSSSAAHTIAPGGNAVRPAGVREC
jgi:hypothetical protein